MKPFLTFLLLGIAATARAELQVGFAETDITPPVGAIMTGPALPITIAMEDPLYAKAIVVRNGEDTLTIVGLDLVKITRHVADRAIAEATKCTGIPTSAILLCPSHNHSSPFLPTSGPNNKDYLATLPGIIADTIAKAHNQLQPARMYLGRSLVYEGISNRRVLSKIDGLAMNTWLGDLDDLTKHPQVLGTEGPVDPELWVARFDALDGKVLGTLVNFTCHPNLRDRKLVKSWSADFPGVIAKHIKDAHGDDTVCVFTQGCSGNINAASGQTDNWRAKAIPFGEAAVDAARRAIPIEGPIPVACIRRDIEVDRSDPDAQRDGAIARLGWRPEAFIGSQRSLADMPEIRSVPVSAARIGPLGIGTNAGELFVEYGIDIKKRSPFLHTIVCELTNDAIGYEPTARGFAHEGYETLAGVNQITQKGIETLVDTAVEMLEELSERD
jgi:hypothetical protein